MKHPAGKIGDLIAIPITDNLFSAAQIIIKTKILYITVFSGTQESYYSCRDIKNERVVLAGWTMDAKIYHGQWNIIDNCEIRESSCIVKSYLIEYNGETWVQNYAGDLIRVASDADKRDLFLKSSYSPVRFERAIRAFNKIEPWSSDYDELLISD